MIEALEHDFFRRALLTGLLASIACGIIGSLVVVKRMASISGGLSHAAFGGVGLGYLLGIDPLIGAAVFTLGCSVILAAGCRRSKHAPDTLIVITWSVGMALGMVFVSLAPGHAPDLMSYLFGSILFVPGRHLVLLAGLDVLVVAVTLLLFKELQAIAFDEEFSEIVDVPVTLLQQVFFALVALTVLGLIQVVGIILVIALLTLPAVIGRTGCDSLRGMMILAILVSAACTTAGLFLSWWLSTAFSLPVPTGPTIILLTAAAHGLSTLARALRNARRSATPGGA